MKTKTTIRYVRFRPSDEGGRIFDFWITDGDHADREISVEIPGTFFEGQNRLHLQEGVGISHAKIKHYLESDESTATPLTLCFDATDLALHREVTPVAPKRWNGFAR